MVKPSALLLLLAVAASQVDLNLSQFTVGSGELNITSCPITFYGHQYKWVDVVFPALAVCFKNKQSDTARECLLLENGATSDRVQLSVVNEVNGAGMPIVTNLATISSTSQCHLKVEFRQGSNDTMNLKIYEFGQQTALRVESVRNFTLPNFAIATMVGDSYIKRWPFTGNELFDTIFLDISGCRHSGFLVAAKSDTLDPDTCIKIECDSSASPKTFSNCTAPEVCQGNGTCALPQVQCTVTGSTVIDFVEKEHSVTDRCAYTLMRHQGTLSFELFAVFRERRRKDVAFLDHLILSLNPPNVKMYLEQGGRVRFGDYKVILNTTTRVIHDIELSKHRTGVIAVIPYSKMKILFDGNTAHVTVNENANVTGLCGNFSEPTMNTSLNTERSKTYSRAGCEVQHSDANDTSIDCSRSTDRCDLMKMAPFTACHNAIKPAPFIKACTDILCNYPQVDGLRCQFFEAYARACKLKNRISLQNWRSTVGCSADPPPCLDQYCSNNEFCGQKAGETHCFCRALFASKYRSTNSLGDPTVCMQKSATLTLANCLLEEKGINYTNLHLSDPTCKGEFDNKAHMVTFHFDDSSNTCGTEVMMDNSSQVIYKNSIRMRNNSNDIITRQEQVKIDFSCLYKRPEIKNLFFKIKDSSVIKELVYGVWNYTLMMRAYTDPNHIHPVGPTTEIQLNQRVWLELMTKGLDNNTVALVTDSCWATSRPLPNDTLQYALIRNGCPEDLTVTIQGNGMGTSNSFSFSMFQFTGQSRNIFLHCEVELCLPGEGNCTPACGSKRRRRSFRSKYAGGNSALITMSWNY